ncbi:MAG: hypothetical protein ACQBVK_05105 [Candidatus Phytoplasma sp. TWB_XP]
MFADGKKHLELLTKYTQELYQTTYLKKLIKFKGGIGDNFDNN